jgi:ribonuclease HII
MTSLYAFDRPYFKVGSFVIGVDEVGRGPLAGPVLAVACHIPEEFNHPLICDSKKLKEKALLKIEGDLKSSPGVFFAYGWASPKEIDEINIYQASRLAMYRAIDALVESHKKEPDQILVDAMPLSRLGAEVHAIIKGDSLSQVIAAASILAKCERDRYMKALDLVYPGYGFAKHKGYPTKAHFQALEALGPCIEHRQSFAPVARSMGLPLAF